MVDQSDVKTNGTEAMMFGGIPIRVDPMIPSNEIWLVKQGRSQTIHIHEGQQAGQTVEEWITKPQVCRIVNIGDPFDWLKVTPSEIKLPPAEQKIGDWPWPDGAKK